MIDAKTVNCFNFVPATDVNFKTFLELANAETIIFALVNCDLGKVKRKALERRLRQLEKESQNAGTNS